MTDEALRELRKLCEAATPGPNVSGFLAAKREAMLGNAEQWARSFSGECREMCKHTAEEHYDARWHLACVYLDVLDDLRRFHAKVPALLNLVESMRGERQAMRESLMHACELQCASHDNARQLWAIRQTANYLGEPFSHERVQAKYDEYATDVERITADRDRLRAALREVCDIAEKHITNDNSALTDESLSRIAAIKREGGLT